MRLRPLFALALALLAACGAKSAPQAPRLVVLYAPCTVNRSFLSPYADGVRYTPALEDFARNGLVFRRHVTECGRSGTDFATLFTGTQAWAHGVYDHPNVLSADNQLIAETFSAAGWKTFYWSGHPMASARLGYAQGVPPKNVAQREKDFERMARTRDEKHLERLTANDSRFEAILQRLAADPDYRAFVQISFTISHEPYNEFVTNDMVLAFLREFPEAGPGVDRAELEHWVPIYEKYRLALNWNFRTTVERLGLDENELQRLATVLEALYATCIHRLDSFFGRLVAAVDASGLGAQALIAFTTDHGETFDHENVLFPWTHGPELAPEVLDVSWLLRGPGVPRGSYEGVTRSIDVFPTLAGLAGLDAPERVEGTDLTRPVQGSEPQPRQLAFSHSALWPAHQIERFSKFALVHTILPRREAQLMSVRVRDGDLIVELARTTRGDFRTAAFDLAADPGRKHALSATDTPRYRQLEVELLEYKRKLINGFDPAAATIPLGESLERLRALGYAR